MQGLKKNERIGRAQPTGRAVRVPSLKAPDTKDGTCHDLQDMALFPA